MIPNIAIGDLMVDCADAERARDFYANLTGWEKLRMIDCLALRTRDGLIVLFVEPDIPYIPPVWPEELSKQQKQMHFNFQVDDLQLAVDEAVRMGATKAAVQYGGEHFVTMLDTEGHPFCFCAR